MEITKVPIVHLQLVKDDEIAYGKQKLDTPEKAAKMMHSFLGTVDREYLIVCCVDVKSKPTCIQVVGIGTINSCEVSIPEIFKVAVLSNAAYILVFHTHPSGETEPSREDIRVTHRIRKAGNLFGIFLLDHIILGEKEVYYSFKEQNEHWEMEDL